MITIFPHYPQKTVPPGAVCVCGSRTYDDHNIHDGQSVRRDCAFCRRTIGFPIWYGVNEMAKEAKKPQRFNYPPAFDAWWQAWPAGRRVAKKAAYRAWVEAGQSLREEGRFKTNVEIAEFLRERAEAYAASPAARRIKFVPYPQRWLREGRYDDDPASWEDWDNETRRVDVDGDEAATF